MSQKRMFSKDVTNSDIFLDMPLSSQCLYFHLWMNADDDWFVQPRSIIRLIQAKDDDLKILVAKWFCIVFADSVVVITHRKQNNQIQKDRYKPSVYQEHLKVLWLLPNKQYTIMDTNCIQSGYKMDTQISIVESSIDKVSEEESERTPKKPNFKKPSIQELKDYCIEKNILIDCDYFYDHYESNWWMVWKNKMKNRKSTAKNRERRDKKSWVYKDPSQEDREQYKKMIIENRRLEWEWDHNETRQKKLYDKAQAMIAKYWLDKVKEYRTGVLSSMK